VTFKECAIKYIATHESGWRNSKHASQWRSTIETYANPVIGQMLVRDIGLAHVRKVLVPIWTKKTETASRLRGRLDSVLDWATVREYPSTVHQTSKFAQGLHVNHSCSRLAEKISRIGE
jgi:hypothetical protein